MSTLTTSPIAQSLRAYGKSLASHIDQDALRFTGALFLITRVLLIGATYFSGVVPAQTTGPYPALPAPLKTPFWQTWYRWDSGYYIDIAHYGYTPATSSHFPAFFPLYPWVLHLVGFVTNDNYYVAGLIVTNAAWFVALYQLYRLAARDFDARVARGAVIALSVFPTAFFGFVTYPESLFLALMISAVLAMRAGTWGQAALFGFLAALTRQAGAFLILPFVWEYAVQHDITWDDLRHPAQLRDKLGWGVLAGAAIPAGIAAFALWLQVTVGDPLAFLHAQKSWYRTSEFPLFTLRDAVVDLQHPAPPAPFFIARSYQEFLITAFMLVLCVVAWRVLPKSYLLFTYTLFFLFLSQPVGGFPLMSLSRFVLELFPLFIVMGVVAVRQRWFLPAFVAVALPVQLALVVIFAHGGWIV